MQGVFITFIRIYTSPPKISEIKETVLDMLTQENLRLNNIYFNFLEI